MRRTITRSIVVALGLFLVACGGEKSGGAPASSAAPEASAAPVATDAVNTASTTTAAAAPPSASALAPASASAAVAAATASSTPSATPAASGSAAAGAKTYDCGAKGQKPCPMQGWMKSVMGGASSSGDGEKLASALSTVASHPPPGFGGWSAIATGGATKAKAGDIDGAKATCKQCHDQYKEKYKSSMRDRPWP